MTCDEVVRGGTLEEYVAGHLDEEAQASVELHVFECDACAARLDDLLTVRTVLAEPRQEAPIVLGPRRIASAWYGQPLAIAAGIATLMFSAAGAIWWTRAAAPSPRSGPTAEATTPATPPAADLGPSGTAAAAAEAAVSPRPPKEATPAVDWASLSAFEAPALLAFTLRGDAHAAPGGEALLEGARAAYVEGRYRDAANLFEQWGQANPQTSDVTFYRGVSRLKAGEVTSGLTDLAAAVASEETPYAVEAHLYVAHGLLARRDVAGAREALSRYVQLDGDFTDAARRLLQRLPPDAPPQR